MAPEQFIDYEARSSAALASQEISSHKDQCAERWMEARKATNAHGDAIARVHDRIDDVHSRINKIIWGVGGSVLLGLAGLVMQIAFGKA